MNSPLRKVIQCTIGLAAIASFATAMHYMHKAGCSGDVKTGALGDPTLALQFEDRGMIWGFMCVGLLASLVVSFPGRSLLARAGTAIAACVLGYMLLVASAVQVETAAVQSCFNTL